VYSGLCGGLGLPVRRNVLVSQSGSVTFGFWPNIRGRRTPSVPITVSGVPILARVRWSLRCSGVSEGLPRTAPLVPQVSWVGASRCRGRPAGRRCRCGARVPAVELAVGRRGLMSLGRRPSAEGR
jgi:hypothetical protein